MSIQAPASVATVSGQPAPSIQGSGLRDQAAFIEQLKRLYSTDQQAEYLFIQAEADSLLVQLEQMKAQQHQA